jgi:hypothetical protein
MGITHISFELDPSISFAYGKKVDYKSIFCLPMFLSTYSIMRILKLFSFKPLINGKLKNVMLCLRPYIRTRAYTLLVMIYQRLLVTYAK